jgi:hypothetical protein
MHRIELETTLPVPAAQAADVFWDIARWHRIWNPIQRVAVGYDDGTLQEFEMDLFWHDAPITIRTIRLRRADGDIEFFSPNPPGEFSHHIGWWRFSAIGATACRLSAVREFVVRRLPDESGDVYECRKENAAAAFRARLNRILDAFSTHAANGFIA